MIKMHISEWIKQWKYARYQHTHIQLSLCNRSSLINLSDISLILSFQNIVNNYSTKINPFTTYSPFKFLKHLTWSEYHSLEHLQKIFYNLKYKVFCSPNRNFKTSNWSFEEWNFIFEVSLFKTSNLKFHIFICILVSTITYHIYDS